MAAAPARAVDRTTWRRLLETALEIIDSLSVNGYGALYFRLAAGPC